MSDCPRPQTLAEIERSLVRIRRGHETVLADSPAAEAFRAAIGRYEHALAEIEGAQHG